MWLIPSGLSAGVLPLDRLQLVCSLGSRFNLQLHMQKHLTSDGRVVAVVIRPYTSKVQRVY